MSYQIQYPVTNRLEKQYLYRKKSMNRSVIAIVCAVLLIITVYIVGVERISEYFIPGDKEITISAFNEMQNNLKSGMPAKEAITVFCSEILESANVQ